MSPAAAFELLLARPALPLSAAYLTREIGLYALWDHSGAIRYIGSTPRSSGGFLARIGKHIGGTEGHSHKFSQAYCTGRLWRANKLHPAAGAVPQDPADADVAKKLRCRFIRRHCLASCLPIATGQEGLEALELAVIEIARRDGPPGMLGWHGRRFTGEREPVALVDALLAETPGLRAAVERQGELYRRYVDDGSA